MNLTTSVVLTAGIVTLNRILTEQPIEMRFVVGSLIYMLFVSIIAQANADFANKLALAVMVVALFLYAPDVVRRLGF